MTESEALFCCIKGLKVTPEVMTSDTERLIWWDLQELKLQPDLKPRLRLRSGRSKERQRFSEDQTSLETLAWRNPEIKTETHYPSQSHALRDF